MGFGEDGLDTPRLERPTILSIAAVDQCLECRFVYASVEQPQLASEIELQAAHIASVTERTSSAALRSRGEPDVWSPLEYACHVRDVLVVQRSRIHEALTTPLPVFSSMRREELVTERRYNLSEPLEVAHQIRAGATALADLLRTLTPQDWTAGGVYNFPTTETRSVDWIARHTLHELVHHLRDLKAGCRA